MLLRSKEAQPDWDDCAKVEKVHLKETFGKPVVDPGLDIAIAP
jgi:hypothetical protein